MNDRRERIAVVGAGLMGTSIALDWARAGFSWPSTTATATGWLSLTRRAREIGQALVEGGVITANELNLAVGTPDRDRRPGRDGWQADYVAEAIVEDLAVKQSLYAELDAITRPDAVLASNTSSLMPSALAEPTRRPERVLVVHYFNPGHLIPVVEVVLGPKTSPETVETSHRAAARGRQDAGRPAQGGAGLHRQPPPVGAAAGGARAGRGWRLLDGGPGRRGQPGLRAAPGRIRPVHDHDMAGLDVWQAITSYLYPLISDAHEPQASLAERAARGDLGLKSGRGFYELVASRGRCRPGEARRRAAAPPGPARRSPSRLSRPGRDDRSACQARPRSSLSLVGGGDPPRPGHAHGLDCRARWQGAPPGDHARHAPRRPWRLARRSVSPRS